MNYKTILIVCICILSIVPTAIGGVKKTILKKHSPITQEAALLSQVDTVSLYLTSDKVVFAPRLTPDKTIDVETTILSPRLIKNKKSMQNYMSRLINTFNSLLKERLSIYAPDIAKTFNSDKDIIFNVNAGSKRIPVGVWKGGTLQGDTTKAAAELAKSKPVDEEKPVEPDVKDEKGCGCPARLK